MSNYAAIDMIYGPPMDVLSRCMRGFFIPKQGCKLVVGDFTNVEGRGVAWFSGEDWKIKAFQAADMKTGPGIYELAYAKSFDVPVESVKNPSFERQVGKVMELAFGYQGGVGAFTTMGETLGVKVGALQANSFKEAWRSAHPRVVGTWKTLEKAAIAAVRAPEQVFEAGYPGRQAKFKVAGSFLWCLLPSGRAICYPYPKLLPGHYGDQLTYMARIGQGDKVGIVADPKNSSNWARVSTYGGSLMENVVQGFCRDLLVDCVLIPFHNFVVMHVHDEGVLEIPEKKAEQTRQDLERSMRTPPPWAAGFPLWADVSVMGRYGKG